MTKEELEKEAIAKYKTGSYPQLHPDFRAFIHGYLASAEPREKRISKLEKENAELKAQIMIKEYQEENYLNKIDHKEEVIKTLQLKIERLEKENAELKEKLKPENCLKLLAKEGYIKFTSEQLTKAKEIIRALLKHTYGQNLNTQNDFNLYLGRIKQAEQFLKEIEK